MYGVLDDAVLQWSASMAEFGAVGHEVGLQLGHILALEDVPNSPCPSVPAPYTLSQLPHEICRRYTHIYKKITNKKEMHKKHFFSY